MNKKIPTTYKAEVWRPLVVSLISIPIIPARVVIEEKKKAKGPFAVSGEKTLPPAIMITAIVSPITRPKPKITAPIIFVSAVLKTILKVVLDWLIPKANEA